MTNQNAPLAKKEMPSFMQCTKMSDKKNREKLARRASINESRKLVKLVHSGSNGSDARQFEIQKYLLL